MIFSMLNENFSLYLLNLLSKNSRTLVFFVGLWHFTTFFDYFLQYWGFLHRITSFLYSLSNFHGYLLLHLFFFISFLSWYKREAYPSQKLPSRYWLERRVGSLELVRHPPFDRVFFSRWDNFLESGVPSQQGSKVSRDLE